MCQKKDSNIIRPKRELVGFRQVVLDAGETRRVEISICTEDLSVYNPKNKCWEVEDGEYEFSVCSDSESVISSAVLEIKGEKIERNYSDEVLQKYNSCDFTSDFSGEFEQMSGLTIPQKSQSKLITLDSRFCEIKDTKWGKAVYNSVLKRIRKDCEGKSAKHARFMETAINNSTIRQMTMTKAIEFPYNVAEAVVCLANGKLFKALLKFMKKVK